VVDEPNNSPVTNSLEVITRKRRIIEGKAYVDYTLQMAVYADGLDEIRKAREAGMESSPSRCLMNWGTGQQEWRTWWSSMRR